MSALTLHYTTLYPGQNSSPPSTRTVTLCVKTDIFFHLREFRERRLPLF